MIYFTSDQHYGHTNIIAYSGRPFSDVHEMNLALTQNYNRIVRPEDTVYHLGDFALDERFTRDIVHTLHGRKVLVPGNHDKCHQRKERWKRTAQKYVTWGFTAVFHEVFVVFQEANPRILLSHCPSSDYEDPRYPEYRPDPTSYDILIHGHVHERWKVKHNPCGSVMVNAGVDVWNYEPVTLDDLIQAAGYEPKFVGPGPRP